MLINIRKMVFETNSSMSHSLTINGLDYEKGHEEDDYYTDYLGSMGEYPDSKNFICAINNIIKSLNNPTLEFDGIDKDGNVRILNKETGDVVLYTFSLDARYNG